MQEYESPNNYLEITCIYKSLNKLTQKFWESGWKGVFMACMVGDGGVNSSREKVSRNKVGNIKTALVIKN